MGEKKMTKATRTIDRFNNPVSTTIDRFICRKTTDVSITEMAENPDAHPVEALKQALSILSRASGNERQMSAIKASIAKRG
jgi:hypothetical protein